MGEYYLACPWILRARCLQFPFLLFLLLQLVLYSLIRYGSYQCSDLCSLTLREHLGWCLVRTEGLFYQWPSDSTYTHSHRSYLLFVCIMRATPSIYYQNIVITDPCTHVIVHVIVQCRVYILARCRRYTSLESQLSFWDYPLA